MIDLICEFGVPRLMISLGDDRSDLAWLGSPTGFAGAGARPGPRGRTFFVPADANIGVLAEYLLRAKLHLVPPRVLRRASVIYKREG
jgi:hypothetical protein